MSNPRADIFDENTDDLDLSGFEPKQPGKSKKSVNTLEQVRAVTEANKFTRRSPTPPTPSKPTRRIYRTGRNVQLNIKASQSTIETFYRIADQQGWVLGETLERALEALDRSLKSSTK